MANRKRNRRPKALKKREGNRRQHAPKTVVMKAARCVETEAQRLCRAMRTNPVEAQRVVSRAQRFDWCTRNRSVIQQISDADALLRDAIALRSWASNRMATRNASMQNTALMLQPYAAAVRKLERGVRAMHEQRRRQTAIARLGGGSFAEWSTDRAGLGTFYPHHSRRAQER